jgi:hypothetical protein
VDLLQTIVTALVPYGLNLIGTTTVAAYEALVPVQYHVATHLPQAKTIVVIGNGGRAFWAGFRTYCEARPAYQQHHEHPLDDYTVEVIEGTLTPLLTRSGAAYRYLYPFRFSTEPVSFMHLAQAAGLAGPSILGVVIHPEYGPWVALRAALIIDQEGYLPPVAADFHPCLTCTERPCITACPAGAVSTKKGWDILICVQHRLRITSDCTDQCDARYGCIYGRAHRYPPDERQYHQERSFAVMRQYFATDKGK